jgi:alpha-methylacyl-CoA racemase
MTQAAPSGPLAGLKVLEFAAVTPPSVAGMMLSGMGADVIRIDRRDDEADSATNTLRRGRRSIALDLKHSAGRELARRLAREADIVIEGYRPGVMERLGLGPSTLLEDNPALIYGRLTGWGQNGPCAQLPGHDITYLALTGALYAMGPGDGPPVPPLNWVADLGAGTLFLLLGVLAALHERTRSGLGQVVDAAMVDAVPTLSATILRERARGTWIDERNANYIDGGAPFYRSYTCSDGGFIAVGAIEPHFYSEFVDGLGFDPGTLPDQWDRPNWPALSAAFADRIAKRPREEWVAQFEGTNACVSPVLPFEEAAAHPQLVQREAFVRIDGHLQPGAAPKLDRTPIAVPGPAPARGAQTREILSGLGLSVAEIDGLLASGVAYIEEDLAKEEPCDVRPS